MDLNTDGAKAIAALIALNAGLLVSHHVVRARADVSNMLAQKAAARAEICETKAEAHMAAMQARMAARAAVRDAMRARKEAMAEAARAAVAAPRMNAPKVRDSVSDYVHCAVSSGMRTIVSAN